MGVALIIHTNNTQPFLMLSHKFILFHAWHTDTLKLEMNCKIYNESDADNNLRFSRHKGLKILQLFAIKSHIIAKLGVSRLHFNRNIWQLIFGVL